MMSPRHFLRGLAVVFLSLTLNPSGAFAFPNFHNAPTRALLERFFQTEAGATFARTVLGTKVTRFNPAGADEVIHTLMHPENRALADAFERRLTQFDLSIQAQTRGHLSEASSELIAREAARSFAIHSELTQGSLVFADGEAVSLFTASEARSAEFLMGGERVPVRAAQQANLTAPPRGFLHNSFEQFLQWEELTGIRYYRESTQFFGLKMAQVASGEVNIQIAKNVPESLQKLFVRGDQVLWPKHPFNTEENIPFLSAKTQEQWPARLTSSRSMVIWNKASGKAFSLKAPTNHPHRAELQIKKVDLRQDIEAGVYRSDYLLGMDQHLSQDQDLEVLPEVFSAASKTGGNGFVVRDLSALMDGNYYLPALSIPFVGHHIARLNGQEFAQFWQKSYAELLGRSKAKLLVRYGLQMETPNCQNMLIQLDRQMRPTGKLVFRDISDSRPLNHVAEAIGQKNLLLADRALGFKVDANIKPRTDNSFWRMNEDAHFRVDAATLTNWKLAHDQAFVRETLRLLGKTEGVLGDPSIHHLDDYLRTAEGQQALARFHQLAN